MSTEETPKAPPKTDTPAPAGCLLFGLIAVGAVLVLSVLGVFLFILNGESFLEDRKPGLREALHNSIQQWDEEGKIPEAHEALFQEFAAMADREDAGAMAIMMMGSLLQTVLEDDKIDEKELEQLQATLAYLEKNPAPIATEITRFQREIGVR